MEESFFQMRKLGCFSVACVVLICVFLNNEVPSVNNMEARNYITAREMLENGSWLFPTMNGKLRIAKPPLPTWITALAMKWAGTDANRKVNRIPAGICGALLALFTFLLARRFTGDRALAATAVLILVTGLLFLSSTRKNFWDIYAHMAMAGAIWAAAKAVSRQEGKNRYFFLCSFLMAFSFLSKGPVALWAMFFPFGASYLMVYGAKGLRENWRGLAFSLGIAILLSASWPIYVLFNTPRDALAVGSKEMTNWFTNHTEKPWYYMLNLHQVAGAWTFFLLYAMIAPFVEKDWKIEERFFAYWFILTLLVLSIIPEKKVRYLLPATVPGSIAAAIAVYRLRDAGHRAWKYVYGPFCFVAGAACFAASGVLLYYSPAQPALMIFGSIALATAGIVIVSGFLTKRTKNTHLAAAAALSLSLVFFTPLKSLLPKNDTTVIFMSLREIPELRGRGIYFAGDLPEELVWGAGRKVQPVEPDQIPSLLGKSSHAALITEGKQRGGYPGMRLVKSLQADDKTYNIYCPLQEILPRDSRGAR